MMQNSDMNIMLPPFTYDPWEGLTQACPDVSGQVGEPQTSREKRVRRKTEQPTRKKARSSAKSYVISKERTRGLRLIQIKVCDLTSEPSCSTAWDPDEHSESDDNVMLSAQYVVTENYDEIMDMTESVIKKISKNLCNDNL
ncbi:uncharacterized protein LOC114365374 [Ostrinia furnacalis]|uniref:uncharacterized protein LOC114365374 n=1 Tax=Ostrinia furnacalis TaxID=93504 RepID=UPI00103DF9CB|nr:uncharacterized protein LOC114365374 [Ostrinia furnacalis]